jgi:predicted RNA-binding protein with PUA-like domain
MQYWMMKTEPGEFSFDDLVRDGKTVWDGVRNHQAKKNMTLMKQGDQVLIYHSVTEKAVVGIAEVSREAYADPTDNPDGAWRVVDVTPVRKLKKPVSLAQVKACEELAEIALVRQQRLSVMPLTEAAFKRIIAMGS